MPFARPTLKVIRDRVLADVKARFGITSVIPRRSLLRDLTDAFGAGLHGNHGHIEYMSRQLFVHSMEAEYLDQEASLYKITRKAATFATGNVVFTGTDGSVIPAGTVVQRGDGAEFLVGDDGVIAGGTVTVTVTARVAGVDGDTEAGVSLSLVSAIAGVSSSGNVDVDGIAGGIDTETDTALRQRILARKRQPPHGGASFDYENWALEVAGVTRAWVYPNHLGLGTVGLAFVMDDSDPIIPDAAKVAEVQAYIEDLTRKPVTAQLEVFAPVAYAIDLDISLSPNTAAVQAAVTAEIADFLRREGEPGATIYLSRINEAISVAQGEENHVLTSPVADIVLSTGEIPVIGAINFVAV